MNLGGYVLLVIDNLKFKVDFINYEAMKYYSIYIYFGQSISYDIINFILFNLSFKIVLIKCK